MGKFGNVKWGNGEMGKWENGEMGKWGNGETGKWKWQTDGYIATYIFNILFSVLLITYNLSFL